MASIEMFFTFDIVEGFSTTKAIGWENVVECTFCLYGTKSFGHWNPTGSILQRCKFDAKFGNSTREITIIIESIKFVCFQKTPFEIGILNSYKW